MSPPLRVPLEVLERILSFAFTPLSSPSSSSPISSSDLLAPPLGTSHLLLISKGFRQLALPLYYSTISIVQEEDWSAFLDPENGLLVGEDNEERASFVKELWINVAEEAEIPMDYTVIRKALERCLRPERVLIELEEVVLPDLDLLRFFLCGRHSRSRTSTSSETYRSARHYGILTNLWGETTFLRVADEFWESEELYSCSPSAENPLETAVFDNFYERRIDELLMETELPSTYDLQEQAIEERDDSSWGLLVDPDLPPRTVHVGLDALGEVELADIENREMDSLVIYPPTGLNLELEKDRKDALDVFQAHGFLKHALEASLEFEGFPRSFWELVRGTHEFELGEDWVWRSEDGTMLGVKDSFEKIVPREVESSD